VDSDLIQEYERKLPLLMPALKSQAREHLSCYLLSLALVM